MRIAAIGIILGLGLIGQPGASPAKAQPADQVGPGPSQQGAMTPAEMRALLDATRETAKATRESVDYTRVVPDILTQILTKLDKIENKLDKVENAIKAQSRRR